MTSLAQGDSSTRCVRELLLLCASTLLVEPEACSHLASVGAYCGRLMSGLLRWSI
jgi:hypothetical protein